MKLTSAQPFWLMRHGIGAVPQPLRRNRHCDVVIVGAGITGALVAEAMTAAGLSVIAVDRRYPCLGSTAASTALLQYEIDTPLADLREQLGYRQAVEAYAACLAGVRKVGRLAAALAEDVGFKRRSSLYYASTRQDGKALQHEYRLRRRAGFQCEYLDARELSRRVDFAAPGAIWSRDAGEVDPWLLTQALFARCSKRDFQLYGRTEVVGLVEESRRIVVHTPGHTIHARQVVIAAGYEADRFLPKPVCRLASSFAIVTEPVPRLEGWPSQALIWETARPYHYLRTTVDKRILVGGETSHSAARLIATQGFPARHSGCSSMQGGFFRGSRWTWPSPGPARLERPGMAWPASARTRS